MSRQWHAQVATSPGSCFLNSVQVGNGFSCSKRSRQEHVSPNTAPTALDLRKRAGTSTVAR
jgi:hypothetical protein